MYMYATQDRWGVCQSWMFTHPSKCTKDPSCCLPTHLWEMCRITILNSWHAVYPPLTNVQNTYPKQLTFCLPTFDTWAEFSSWTVDMLSTHPWQMYRIPILNNVLLLYPWQMCRILILNNGHVVYPPLKDAQYTHPWFRLEVNLPYSTCTCLFSQICAS